MGRAWVAERGPGVATVRQKTPVRTASARRPRVHAAAALLEWHSGLVAKPPAAAGGFEDAVRAVLGATSPGDVMSYGEVAAEAGYPGAHRAVGNLLRRVDGLPWWRVVAANGRLVPGSEERHARKLAAEGVVVVDGRVRSH